MVIFGVVCPSTRRSTDRLSGFTQDEVELIALQRKVADAANCAFYDQLRVMGGVGTVARWAEETPPRAQKDRVHLSRDGYVELGPRFAKDLLDAFVGSAALIAELSEA